MRMMRAHGILPEINNCVKLSSIASCAAFGPRIYRRQIWGCRGESNERHRYRRLRTLRRRAVHERAAEILLSPKLVTWKNDILREARETLEILQQENANHPDLADRASSETDRAIELRARDRQRKLISKIDSALQRIDEGTYGYCEETGEPIALKRLDARPIATLSIEAQERHERREKVYRDD